jgi:PPP family 3-phenylpropionic acid transporter
MPFFPMWLESRGLDAPAIGVILSLPIAVRVVATAPLVGFVDRGVSPRAFLIVCSGCLAAAYLALLLAHGAAAILVLVLVMALAQAPVVPLCDLVALEAVRRDRRLDYGRMRLWGSITFLALSVAGGYLIGATTPDAAIWLLAGVALATLAVAPLTVPLANGRQPGDAPRAMRIAQRLPRGLWLVMAAAAFIQASHAGVYGFASLHWREQGFSEAAIGYLWATGVVAEIVLFALAGRIVGRESAGVSLLVLGAAAAVLRFAVMAFAPGLAVSFALQALHGLTFGATHLGAMAALSRLAPAGSRARAQGVLSTTVALGMATATIASGVIFRQVGAGVFAAMAPLAAVGLILALTAGRALSAQPQRVGEGG